MNSSRRGGFPLSYFFASFFGALLVAGAFAYYNYKFSQYKFIDFSDMVFYSKTDVFEPKDELYSLLIFSSNMSNLDDLISKIDKKHTILAMDIYQKRGLQSDDVESISGSINTIIKFIQRLDIYEAPSLLKIKQVKGTLYKQDSPVYVLE